jgi:hypothetical protein
MLHLNLIHLFNFYLALVFLVSLVVRIRQYQTAIGLIRAVPERWPELLKLVRSHHAIFLTWQTVLPALLALALLLVNLAACRLIWPHANLTVGALLALRAMGVVAGCLGLAMLAVDFYATFTVGEIDRPLLERYFDQAEYWLKSWVAPVVRIFTLGYINPRKMVRTEVAAALVQASKLLNSTLWWVIAQVGVRIAFGLSIWLAWAWRY